MNKPKPLTSLLKGAYSKLAIAFASPSLTSAQSQLIRQQDLYNSKCAEYENLLLLQELMNKLKAGIITDLKAEKATLSDDYNAAIFVMKQFKSELIDKENEITALKAIVTGIRKQKRYQGQKFYNPHNQKAETIYLCARWNDYYMISVGRYNVPSIITAQEFNEKYGNYEILPQMNRNAKILNHE